MKNIQKRFWQGLALLAGLWTLGQGHLVQASEDLDIIQEAQRLGYEISEAQRPKAFIVVDANTGNILWGDQVDLSRDPASITKLMAVYLVYEAMAEQGFDETTTIRATATDAAVSQIYEISNNKIVSGVDYPIGDLITAALVKSSNTAVFMLTNYISEGKHSNFVDQMNIKARDLGMTDTHFENAAGAVATAYNNYYLPDRYDLEGYNRTTARDLAILTQHLIREYPQVLDHTDDYDTTIMKDTRFEESFQSYNQSLPGGDYQLDGVNGLKTGSSPNAQFNSVVTAQRGDQTIITVVLGVGDWHDELSEDYRQIFANTLVEKGFDLAKEEAKKPGAKTYASILPGPDQPVRQAPQSISDQAWDSWVSKHEGQLLVTAAVAGLIFTGLLLHHIFRPTI